MAVTAQVYGPTNTGSALATVTGLLDASGRRIINRPGDGEVKVLDNNDAASALQPRNTVRIIEGGQRKLQFRIAEREWTEVGKAASRTVRASGPGLLAALLDGIICPWNDVEADATPLSLTRMHNWASPGLDTTTGWDDPIYAQSRTELLWGDDRPVAYLDPYAGWVWGAPDDTEHDAGPCLFRRWFHLDAPSLFVVYGSGDDAHDWWIDGVQGLDQDFDLDNLDNWNWTWRLPIMLSAGWHLFAAKITNAASTGPGGFIASGWTATPSGEVDELVFITGEPGSEGPGSETIGDWEMMAYPESMPGFTAGRMVRQWVEEAQAREAPTGYECLRGVTLDFDDDEDSDGNTWPVIPEHGPRVGTKIGAAVEDLSEAWVDVDVDHSSSGIAVRMVDKSAGMGEASGVTFTTGTGLKHLSHKVIA